MAYLSAAQLHNQGDRHGLVSKDTISKPNVMALVCKYRERRYAIANISSFAEDAPYIKHPWRQLEVDADPVRLELVVPQPKACEICYLVCGKIDQHKRDSSDTPKN
jgi:hypothetical protein